jgi:hypothetical protein
MKIIVSALFVDEGKASDPIPGQGLTSHYMTQLLFLAECLRNDIIVKLLQN